jgi:hypothetical protein
MARAASLEKQRIRSPMAGLLTDVQVKQVTHKGVLLNIKIAGGLRVL